MFALAGLRQIWVSSNLLEGLRGGALSDFLTQ